jgi:chromosome condensin MukBEF MukE localization factor
VATDLSLFGPTLTSLYKTLDVGRKRGHVPQRAFEDCMNIAEECREVFNEIQRETGIDIKLQQQDPSLFDRMRWAFSRQRQVALWQKRLESLKLSITVQISVMHFGEQVAGTSVLRYGMQERYFMKLTLLQWRTR